MIKAGQGTLSILGASMVLAGIDALDITILQDEHDHFLATGCVEVVSNTV